jgi:hypothetical protein
MTAPIANISACRAKCSASKSLDFAWYTLNPKLSTRPPCPELNPFIPEIISVWTGDQHVKRFFGGIRGGSREIPGAGGMMSSRLSAKDRAIFYPARPRSDRQGDSTPTTVRSYDSKLTPAPRVQHSGPKTSQHEHTGFCRVFPLQKQGNV